MRGLNGLNYDYSKLRKEEVIYKGSVRTNTRVLPLHTAYASRANARDHVTWNARTVTLPPPFEKARPRASYSVIFRSFLPIRPRSSYNSFPFAESHDVDASFVRPPLEGEFPLPGQP